MSDDPAETMALHFGEFNIREARLWDIRGLRLWAPESYAAASDALRAEVCNGCGGRDWSGFVVPDFMYGLNISEACNIHDWMYAYADADIADKEYSDRTFMNNLVRIIVAKTPTRPRLPMTVLRGLRLARARKYYCAVRELGGMYFWNHPGRAEA